MGDAPRAFPHAPLVAVEQQKSRSGGIACSEHPKGPPTVKLVRRIVVVLIIAFAVFYLVTRPQDAANAVQGALGAVWGAGVAVVDFFVALAGG
jgi:hypothetical protein